MHFSRVIGGCDKDLVLTFSNPIALQWEQESYSIIDLPNGLPKCSQPGFAEWFYPVLIIPNSEWANQYAARTHTTEEFKNHQVKHFAFISMEDCLYVLSEDIPTVMLIEVKNA